MKTKMQYYSRRQRLFRIQLPRFFSNRKIRDRLFCYIFEHDRKALLQLYNALNHTDYQDEQALQIVTLDNVVYMSMNNDVAFLLIGTLNLYEHQSTICPNMPLRFLLYVAAEYEALVYRNKVNIYGKKLVTLPAPQCVVFYNGDEEMADDQYLYLSDAFRNEKGEKRNSCMELSVRVLNINQGHNPELAAACGRLGEYAQFIGKIKELRMAGQDTEDAVDNATIYCIDHGILEDILLPRRAEVKKMLLTEYSVKRYLRTHRDSIREEVKEEVKAEVREEVKAEVKEEVKAKVKEEVKAEVKEEVRKEVKAETKAELIIEMSLNGASAEQIAKLTGIPLREIQDTLQNHS